MTKDKYGAKRPWLILAAIAAVLSVIFVITLSLFSDREMQDVTFTTATFNKDGYLLDTTHPTNPFVAGETVETIISESNNKDRAIDTTIRMSVTWTSPDTDCNIFGSDTAADNAIIKINDTVLTEDDIALSDDKHTATFDFPVQYLDAGGEEITRKLSVEIPASLKGTGELSFVYESVHLQQSPKGFSADYSNDQLNSGEEALDFTAPVGWTAAANDEYNGKSLMAFLTHDEKNDEYGLEFQFFYDCTESAMRDYTEDVLPGWSVYADVISYLTFQDGMTSSGAYSFKGFEKLTGLDLPSSMNRIGAHAFEKAGLISLVLPANVTTLEKMSFGHNNDLTEISFEHEADAYIKLPVPGSNTGAFYVEAYVQTQIIGENTHVQSYDWVADNRSIKIPVSIEVISEPDKTTYNAGDDFDPTGMEVLVTYKYGSTATLTDMTVDSLSFPDSADLQYGTDTVTVEYTENDITVSNTVPISVTSFLSDLNVGTTVTLDVESNPTEFIVVHQGNPDETMYDSSCDGTWLLMKDVYQERQWHSSQYNDYSASSVHSYLTSDFLSLFDSDIQTTIQQAKIPYVDGNGSASAQGGSVASGSNGLSTKVFLLSSREVGFTNTDYSDGGCLSYFIGTATTDSKRIGYLNGVTFNWWLRTPATDSTISAHYVGTSGGDGTNWCNASAIGIRPAMVLPSDAIVNPDSSISVAHLIPEKMEVSAQPDKTSYEIGEDFDPAGMKITVTYRDGSQKVITDMTDSRIIFDGGEDLQFGTDSVTVQYTEYGVELSDTVSINVTGVLSAFEVGTIVTLDVDGTPTEFIIINQGNPDETMYDASCDGTWLLMKNVYEARQWHNSSSNSYKASTIHTYLNGTFLNLFDADVQSVIKQVKIPYVNGVGNEGSVASGSSGLPARIFLLSGYEVGWTTSTKSYFPVDGACLSYFSGTAETDAKRICYYNGSGAGWWLRSPDTRNSEYVWTVRYNGGHNYYDAAYSGCIRPALVLPKEAVVDAAGSIDVSHLPKQIEVTTDPDKTSYEAGEKFDPTGMSVTVTYCDGSQKIVTDMTDPRITFDGGEDLQFGTDSVTIKYTEYGVVLSDTVSISVTGTLSDLEEGEIVTLNENGSPVEFYVAKHDYESGLNGAGRTLLVRKEGFVKRQWHSSLKNAYASSDIDTWLNNNYKALLDNNIQTAMGETQFYYTPGNGNTVVSTLSRSVFLLSAAELGLTHADVNTEGSELPTASILRVFDYNNNYTAQWTRTPWYPTNSTHACLVNIDGTLGNIYCSSAYYARPSFTLPGDALVNSEGSVNVDPLVPEALKITTPPDKTMYEVGDTFDGTGMEVEVTYKDGSTRVLSDSEYTIDGDNLEWNQTEVTVTYTNYGITVEATVDITITGSTMEDVAVGDTVLLNVAGEPTEFIVVQQGNPGTTLYDASCDGTWLLMKDIYETRKWHSSRTNIYANSSIHSYLNSTFLLRLDSDIRSAAKQVRIPYVNGTGGSAVASGSNGLAAQIFLLSAREVGVVTYGNYTSSADGAMLDYFLEGESTSAYNKRIASLDGTATHWWLRSPVVDYTQTVLIITSGGSPASNHYCTDTDGVRPALILPSGANINSDGTIDVTNIIVDKIEVTQQPAKTQYASGQLFDPTGMEITATYKDGHTEVLSDTQYTVVDGEETLTSGQTAVTISYTSGGVTAETTVDLTVAGTLLSDVTVGETVLINENGSPVEFYVAQHDYESELNGTGRTLLVRKYLYDKRLWDLSSASYCASSIDYWLTHTYKALLDTQVQTAIGSTTIPISPLTVSSAERSVFLLSATELGCPSSQHAYTEGSQVSIADTLKYGTFSSGAQWHQWTRSTSRYDPDAICYASSVGVHGYTEYYNWAEGDEGHGSRPCFTLPDDAIINDDKTVNVSHLLSDTSIAQD